MYIFNKLSVAYRRRTDSWGLSCKINMEKSIKTQGLLKMEHKLLQLVPAIEKVHKERRKIMKSLGLLRWL